MAEKPRALIFTSIQGHASIADAIGRKLMHAGWQTMSATYEDAALSLYRWVYRYSPSLCRIYYSALFLPGIKHIVAAYTKKSHGSVYKIATQSFPADVIIGTSYGFDALILADRKRLQSEGKPAPLFVNIVVDPRTFFMTNVVDDADLNCVFDEVIAQRCKKAHPRAVVEPVGWFVRPEFNRSIDKKEMRRALGLDENKLTLLFAAGSEGEVKSAQLIPQLLSLGKPLQVVLACGSNEELRKRFQPLVEQYANHASITFLTLPFTKEVYKYVRAADLLVGKAGPNTIFEAAACGTPFFATTHIAGQEDGNLDIIREHKIGYVEEDLNSAKRVLSQIIAQPELLKEFDEPMKKLAEYNDGSIHRLTELIGKLKRS